MAVSYTHCNGLAMFIQDLEKMHNISFEDASHKAAVEWEDLPEDKRMLYHEKAMESISPGVDLTRKFNSEGLSLAHVAMKQMQESERWQIMLLLIEDKLRRLAFPNELLEEKFIICHVNYFYIVKDKYVKPAEIALSEFNLKNGLLRTVHKFIHPGNIQLGYRCEAKEMEKEHGISLDDPNLPFVDLSQLYSSIINFIQVDNNKTRPVYTMPTCTYSDRCVNAVEDTLKQIATAAGYENVTFSVFQCDVLLFKILQRVSNELKLDLENNNQLYFSKCATWIENDSFSHCKKLACSFHEDNDLTEACSLSIVKRWTYTLCDRILPYMGIEVLRGSHVPINAKPRNVWRKRQPNVPTVSSEGEKINRGGGKLWKTTQSHRGRGRGSGSVESKPAALFKPFTIEDHSTGSVTWVGQPETPKPMTQFMDKVQTNVEGDTKPNSGLGGGYAVALRGKAPPSISNSLADFPDLRISGKCSKCHMHCTCMKNLSGKCIAKPDGGSDLEFPPLQAANPWRRGKK